MKKGGAGKIGEILHQRPGEVEVRLTRNPTTEDSQEELKIISL